MPRIMKGNASHGHKIVVSLCDYSGNWPRPFNELGYTVIHFDLKHGDDVLDTRATLANVYWLVDEIEATTGHKALVAGVLMACPCTDFAGSGARWWKGKDAAGTTDKSVAIVRACLAIRDALKPRWWALENPAGRLHRLVPEIGRAAWYFNPCEYAGYTAECWGEDAAQQDCYTKRTGIWTNLPKPFMNPREPVMYTRGGKRGSWMWAKLGGKSERTKELRSMTPMGFAMAFAVATVSATAA